jgi:uncharacterized protein YdeI (YjbR/CyaY-like superfamily)
MDSGKAQNLPVKAFEDQQAWVDWLHVNHAASLGLWIRLAKKASARRSVSYAEAVEIALCYGWIDGQSKRHNETTWLLKFTPRRRGSIWSKINREKAERLISDGRMQAAGLAEVDRAKQDGRWDAAYDSPRAATVPKDLQAALKSSPQASAFFGTLNSRNRFAILFRIQNAKKPATRARRIQQFIRMLESHEKLYP